MIAFFHLLGTEKLLPASQFSKLQKRFPAFLYRLFITDRTLTAFWNEQTNTVSSFTVSCHVALSPMNICRLQVQSTYRLFTTGKRLTLLQPSSCILSLATLCYLDTADVILLAPLILQTKACFQLPNFASLWRTELQHYPDSFIQTFQNSLQSLHALIARQDKTIKG